ncbi:MAG: RHS repeat-associated core domain-containing protein, partial [Patescibacteria group bacterium]|nr:RHS repeat-associated core domain-containing protein [Patescibacteria group bacterium]
METRDATVANAQAETLEARYQYVWSVRYVDAAILRDENTDTDGLCDDARVYYLTDANFNVTALIDATGAVVERYVYTPYGEVTIYNADWSATRDVSAVDNTHLYTGRDLDAATGLYYYRARWYDAGQGNFLQRDPLGFAAGDANLYRYCGGSPTGSVDPSGLLADGNHHSGGSSDGQVWRSEVRDFMWGWTKGFHLGLVQGACNIVNGLQDSLIATANLPATVLNAGGRLSDKLGILPGNWIPGVPDYWIDLPYVDSRDWSRDLVTHEATIGWFDTHNASKFVGATSVEVGAGAVGGVLKARRAASL